MNDFSDNQSYNLSFFSLAKACLNLRTVFDPEGELFCKCKHKTHLLLCSHLIQSIFFCYDMFLAFSPTASFCSNLPISNRVESLSADHGHTSHFALFQRRRVFFWVCRVDTQTELTWMSGEAVWSFLKDIVCHPEASLCHRTFSVRVPVIPVAQHVTFSGDQKACHVT